MKEICIILALFALNSSLSAMQEPGPSSLKARARIALRTNPAAAHIEFVNLAGAGDISKVIAYLKVGINVDARADFGRTALHWAAAFGPAHVVELLFSYGADVNAKDIYGSTALIFATNGDREKIVDLLIDHGANINLESDCGETCLITAVVRENVAMVKKLIALGADVDQKNKNADTAINYLVLSECGRYMSPAQDEIGALLLAASAKKLEDRIC